MKTCMFNGGRLGVIDGDEIVDCSEVLECLGASRYPLPRYDLFIAALPQLGHTLQTAAARGTRISISEAKLESPVANPGKLIAAPVNYQAHLDEAIADEATFSRAHVRKIQETGLFLKATSSLIGVGEPIVTPLTDRRTDHEIELVAIVGRPGRNIARDDALSYVAGYCIGLDITIRGPEERSLRKSLDSYSVLGPWLVTADEIGDPSDLALSLHVNGEMRQRANTRDLIMDVADLIVFASTFYTLQPGDVLFTGTPEGVGPIQPGDRIDASIDRIGSFAMDVVS